MNGKDNIFVSSMCVREAAWWFQLSGSFSFCGDNFLARDVTFTQKRKKEERKVFLPFFGSLTRESPEEKKLIFSDEALTGKKRKESVKKGMMLFCQVEADINWASLLISFYINSVPTLNIV